MRSKANSAIANLRLAVRGDTFGPTDRSSCALYIGNLFMARHAPLRRIEKGAAPLLGLDQEFGKKLVEEEELLHFLALYEVATGETFPELAPSETPDFVGHDQHERTVGIELTQLKFAPDYMFWKRAIKKREWADDTDAFWRILHLLAGKAEKLPKGNWPGCERKILVIQLVDYPLSELMHSIDTDLPDGRDFSEILLADYTILDMYGGVDLFPIAHPELSGPFLVASTDRKPWG